MALAECSPADNRGNILSDFSADDQVNYLTRAKEEWRIKERLRLQMQNEVTEKLRAVLGMDKVDVSIEVEEGSIVALVGSNGAGKSTLLKAIAGLLHPSHGQVVFMGEDLGSQNTKHRVDRGIVLVRNVRAVNIVRDFLTSFRDIFGGRSGAYQDLMRRMQDEVIIEAKEEAAGMGANAIVGLTVDFDSIGAKGKSLLMVSAKGTAVVIQ